MRGIIISCVISFILLILLFVMIVLFEWLTLQELWWFSQVFKFVYAIVMMLTGIAVVMVPLGYMICKWG